MGFFKDGKGRVSHGANMSRQKGTFKGRDVLLVSPQLCSGRLGSLSFEQRHPRGTCGQFHKGVIDLSLSIIRQQNFT